MYNSSKKLIVEDLKDIGMYVGKNRYESIKFILFSSMILYVIYTVTDIVSHTAAAGKTF